MKISIVTEGFRNTGLGHITRCLSLYEAFKEVRLLPKIYLNGDENSRPLLNCCNHELINWLENPSELLNKSKSSDVIIVDSYLANSAFYESISLNCDVPVFLDDNIRINYPRGYVVNGTILSEYFNYPVNENIKYLLGSRFIPLRKEFRNLPSKQISTHLNSILITMGGQDIRNLTIPILQSIQNSFPELSIKVVVGKEFNNQELLYSIINSKTELIVSPDARQMFELMRTCDIAVTTAGQTVYEMAASGIPAIAIVAADNQKNNMAGWKKTGFLQHEIYYNDPDFIPKIIDNIRVLDQYDIRKNISEIGRTKVDGMGAERVVRNILNDKTSNKRFYLRQADRNDAELIYNLSNDPEVRNNSINRETFGWENHIDWFNRKLADKNYIILLAFTLDERFIGQIRFEIIKDSAIISISISKEFRGRGFSKEMLVEGGVYIFGGDCGIKRIEAFIRPENASSIKAFKSAGYEFDQDVKINNELLKKFIIKK